MVPNYADSNSNNDFHDSQCETNNTSDSPHERVVKALNELHNLLKEYAPVWFTKRHDDRINFALRDSDTSLADSLHEIFHLLEEYAPAWYQPEHREKAKSALRLMNKNPMSPMKKSTLAGSQG